MPAPGYGPTLTRCTAALPLGLTLGFAALSAATVPEQDPPPAPAVIFELSEPQVSGVLDPGQPLQLTIHLTGLTPPDEGVVAIIEGEPFVRRLVPMELDEESNAFRSLVILEPAVAEAPSNREKAVRVRATFARLQGMVLDHFLTRVVYVTVQLPPEADTVNTAPSHQAEDDVSQEFTEERLDTLAPLDRARRNAFSEEDIIPNPVPAEAQLYWRQVSERIGQIWRQPQSRPVAAGKGTPGVGVRFRLHANGEAQLIQIERSSGVPEVDEAGLRAVLHAHPFPPFPPDVNDDAVDMHIELGRAPSAPSTSSRQNGSLDEPAPTPALDPPLESQ